MNLLLDTNIVLWTATADRKLSPHALELMDSRDSNLFLSSVSTWEIAIKYAAGTIPLHDEPSKLIPLMILHLGLQTLDIIQEHALEAGRLPKHHRDPFDRMLIAQARVEGFTLLTGDRFLKNYDVQQIYAGR